MKAPVFTGTSTAIITPLKNDKIDFASFASIMEIQKIAGIAAITVCGTTGEAVTMTPEEQTQIIKACVNTSGKMKVIAGAGTNDTKRALYQSQAAEDAGADALLIVTPYYNKPTQKGLIEHYTFIADRVHIPIIMYNVPSRTGVSLLPETCALLCSHPNINGLKDATGDLSYTSKVLSLCGDNINIWSGNDDLTVPMMSIGAKGVISVASNIIPDIIVSITNFCLSDKFGEASKLHREYFDLMKSLFIETNPLPVKTAASLMGLCGSDFRLPLCTMSDNTAEMLKSTMKKYKLI